MKPIDTAVDGHAGACRERERVVVRSYLGDRGERSLADDVLDGLTRPFKELPPTDGRARPLFAYGALIHNECGRRPHFEFGEFVQDWGDEGAQKGWCLYRMGCKGPETFAPCASVRYAEGTSWPVKSGAPCVGCHTPGFWDANAPFTSRLPPPAAFVPDITVDQVGQAAVAAVGLAVVAHGSASIVRAKRNQHLAAKAATGTQAQPAPALASAPMSTLAGFKSRWMTRLRWAYATASQTCSTAQTMLGCCAP